MICRLFLLSAVNTGAFQRIFLFMDAETVRQKSTLLYIPNIIGYVRVVLLFISLFFSKNIFVILYSISYLLDSLDGYAARRFKQESKLGYILDMATDRASSAVLILRVVDAYPKMFIILGAFLMMDVLSHFFCVVCTCSSKVSHKVHASTSIASRILSFYYARPVLFTVCLGSELFLLNILCFKSVLLGVLCGVIFAFKYITNVLQLYIAIISLSQE
ncbi:uncharacterized protein NESG_01063 [Nematocida ausubeli]|uniref:CDP-diacylglycerol--inositol 3-phosphatidyltransferase n=1 Tax=Nematocida ausubeli (strain ATCC PRA-371 / ERTm2) TaxID=1913371 RepID=A0A086J439_NEMA1|nr:uncharacterized protein NESG_01063 [Nematocida ausubeli]KAI5132337.1 CDP-diacylglycerol--inositol 3-phosphatidyltransferase [Nematocida ausubeli]KAI5147007.1 CDP-diacylglycerol--inositol 3-phosphatidyltransferase [Nematocida ausubeli]KFG26907.1 hypothetical protein NESG_01063 [Nematocida ausubeli]